jgi:methyl-accepting chemotaxis protein
MNRESMKWKFVVPVVVSILVILGLSGCFKYARSSANLKAELNKEVTALLDIGALAMIDPIWNIRKDVIKDNAEYVLGNQAMATIEVKDGEGNVLYERQKSESAYAKGNLMPVKTKELTKDGQKVGTVSIRATGYFMKQRLLTEIATTISELMIMVVLLGIVVLFISMKLSKPIQNMALVLKDIAEGEGDLTKSITVTSKDELGEMAIFFNRFIEKLNGIVLSIRDYSRSIASGSEELRMRMEEISQTENILLETSSSTSTAVEEMAGNIATIAENTNHLSMNADATETLAGEGKKAVQGTITGINKVKSVLQEGTKEVKVLGEKTSEIGKIITVINDIADQTNLLALNAAIESARAGEHGRGFAVVADEVRKLAERTTESTKEITKMITIIQQETGNVIQRMEEANVEVINGVALADSTGDILERIVSQVTDLKQMINMVATSTSEQSSATNEISSQTIKVAQSVEGTGAAVNQSTASTKEIAEVCERLNEIVNMFKLREQGYIS